MTSTFFVLCGLVNDYPAERGTPDPLLADGWYWLAPGAANPTDGPHKTRADAERAAVNRVRSWAVPFDAHEEPTEIDPDDERTPDDTNLVVTQVEDGITWATLEGSYEYFQFRSNMPTEKCVRALQLILCSPEFQD